MLSNHHIDLLNTIRWGKLVRQTASNPDLDYLYQLGLITMIRCDDPQDPYVEPHLTEKGQAALDEARRNQRRPFLNMVLSFFGGVAATLVAEFILRTFL